MLSKIIRKILENLSFFFQNDLTNLKFNDEIIYEIVDENYLPLIRAKTSGYEYLIIRGNNFGTVNNPGAPIVFYRSLPGADSQDSNITRFDAIACNVSIPHTEMKCYTQPGAGVSYILELKIEGQNSVVATTTYGIPEITAITGPGASSAQGDGNQTVYISGNNFGPFGNKQFFQSVTYGEQGVEYVADCVHHGHTSIECKTTAGTGADLFWQVTILGQTNLLSSNGRTSYAPPNVGESIPVKIETNGGKIMQLVGSNFGISDSAHRPVETFVDIYLSDRTVRKSLELSLTAMAVHLLN